MRQEAITKRQFRKLKQYDPKTLSPQTESKLYLINIKENILKKQYLFKKLLINEGEYWGNKLLTINSLMYNEENINIPEIVFPKGLITIDDRIEGYYQEFITSNINLNNILQSLNVPRDIKVKYLKEIGAILQKIDIYNKYSGNFYLNDLHEGNFILDKSTNHIRVVDIDGCSISNNVPSPSRYLRTARRNLKKLPSKYILTTNDNFIPNNNTEIFCYNMMVLNTISHSNIAYLTMEDYFTYLQYLKDIGYKDEILSCFEKTYFPCENESVYNYLDELPKDFYRSDINILNYKQKRK